MKCAASESSAAFKAKLGLAALQGDAILAELCSALSRERYSDSSMSSSSATVPARPKDKKLSKSS
jgi:hypothetical protein